MIKLNKNEECELKNIYLNQPVQDGDTLSAQSKRSLRQKGLIESDGKGNNYTTPFGNQVYHSQIKITK